MATKSSSVTNPDPRPEQSFTPPTSLHELAIILEAKANHLKALGDYNVDAANIRFILEALQIVVDNLLSGKK